MSVEVDSLAAASRSALTTDASLFHTLPGVCHKIPPGTAPPMAISIDAGGVALRDVGTRRLRKGSWAQRKNPNLRVVTNAWVLARDIMMARTRTC